MAPTVKDTLQVSEEVRALATDHELLVGGDALHVAGIGWLAQYHCWLDLPASGIELFVRDYRARGY